MSIKTVLRMDSANRNVSQPLRFIFIGGLATLTHLAFALSLTALAPSLSIYVANSIAFLVASLVSFYGHRHVTFRRGGSLPKFLVVALAGFAVNNLLLHGGKAIGLPPQIALTASIVLVPVFTYLASAFWAFARQEV